MSTNLINDISKIYLEQVSVASRAKNVVADDRLDVEQEKTNASMNRLRQQSNSNRVARADAAAAARKVESDVNKSNTYGPQRPKPGTVTGRRIEDPKPTGSKPSGYRVEENEIEPPRERLLAKTKAKREKIKEERNDEPGEGTRQKYGDMRGLDRSGSPTSFGGKWQSKERKAASINKAQKPNDGNLANNYPPYDKITRGDVIAGRLGRDEMGGKKKKNVKEGFSNWRQDLAEVVDGVVDDRNKQIKEKKNIKNKVKTSAIGGGLKLGEAVENLGGTLLEMVEIDEVDFIVESVYSELLEEGYDEDDIEEAIEHALTEATVTYGHDTPSTEKKRESLLSIARKKLSGVKKSASAAVARGARKVAKGALGVARKMEGGKEAPKTVERKPSTYRGAGAGTKERVSSGSYTPPTKKKAEKPSDPWEGSATKPPKAKPKVKDRLGSHSKSDEEIFGKPGSLSGIKTPSGEKSKPKAAAPKRKKKSKLDSLLADIRNESVEINEMPYQVMGSPDGGNEKKIGKPVKSKKYADARAAELEDTHKKTGGKYRSQYVEEIEIDEDAGIVSGLVGLALGAKGAYNAAKKSKRMRDYPKNFVKGVVDPRTYVPQKKREQKEEFQIDEKTLTKMEMKKREEIVKSMKDRADDFEKRYPGRGKEVMYATATKMAKRMVEQALQTQPPVTGPVVDKKKEMLDKQRLANQKMLMQKERQLQNQKMQMKKRGVLPLETN